MWWLREGHERVFLSFLHHFMLWESRHRMLLQPLLHTISLPWLFLSLSSLLWQANDVCERIACNKRQEKDTQIFMFSRRRKGSNTHASRVRQKQIEFERQWMSSWRHISLSMLCRVRNVFLVIDLHSFEKNLSPPYVAPLFLFASRHRTGCNMIATSPASKHHTNMRCDVFCFCCTENSAWNSICSCSW